MGGRSDAVEAKLVEIGGRPVSWFSISGGKHHGAIGTDGAEAVERAIRLGLETGVPVVGFLDTSGADVHEGASALHAWGRLAKAMADASGVVPTVLAVTGTCVSGPSLLLGLVDIVVMTRESFAYVSGPDSVEEFTGIVVDRMALGSASVHNARTGVATFMVDTDEAAADAIADVLEYLPSHSIDDPPVYGNDDPAERDCERAAAVVPTRPTESYDVREVLDDVLDRDSFLELRPAYAPNIVTALGRLDGRPVGIVANQPSQRAGTIDIEASRKAARFVQWCDAFNLPIVTFVDTPGFEPGRTLEWRGMIRHGAELVFAYGEATVPRLCVVLRKAYGGAYIVMDSKGLGNDWCAAWPAAEIAVMGATGAVQILHGRRLTGIAEESDRAEEHAALVEEYEDRFSNPYRAAERGYVDEVIDPRDTRKQLVNALARLATKRARQPRRRHANGPL